MKIIIDCYHIAKKMRGMGVYLYEILEAVKEIPHIEFILITNDAGAREMLYERFKNHPNIHVRSLKAPLPIYEQILLPIYFHFVGADYLLSSGNTASMFGVAKRQILLIHDVYYLKPKTVSEEADSAKRRLGEIYRKTTVREASKKIKRVITVSNFAKQDIIRELQMPKTAVKVIHNGVDVDFFSGYEQYKSKRKSLLFVTGSSLQKNMSSTIKSLLSNQLILQKFEKIDVVGISSAKEIGTLENDFVVYHGHLDREAVKKLYQASSHFMLPSLYESFGIPAIEALMSGCDVYLSNRGAMSSLLSGIGTFYDPMDEASTRSVIDKMVTSQSLSREEYDENIKMAHQYTWQKSIFAFREYINGLES